VVESLGKWRKECDLRWERTKKGLLLTIATATLKAATTAATLTGTRKSPALFANLLSVLLVCLGCCCRVVIVVAKGMLLLLLESCCCKVSDVLLLLQLQN